MLLNADPQSETNTINIVQMSGNITEIPMYNPDEPSIKGATQGREFELKIQKIDE